MSLLNSEEFECCAEPEHSWSGRRSARLSDQNRKDCKDGRHLLSGIGRDVDRCFPPPVVDWLAHEGSEGLVEDFDGLVDLRFTDG